IKKRLNTKKKELLVP
ncbi:hypothetical protein S7711_11625, partial [Stachybotrys chartarum IBT 7711]